MRLRCNANAAVFSLSETQLPAGTYVVTTEGYWPIQEWVAAHPGKAIPASIIVIPEAVPVLPTQTIKVKTVHEHDNHDQHDWKNKKWHVFPDKAFGPPKGFKGVHEGDGGHKDKPVHTDHGSSSSSVSCGSSDDNGII